ncbi:MAG: hypothetical protein ACRDMV_19350 [Streptosporangiales bacterium]
MPLPLPLRRPSAAAKSRYAADRELAAKYEELSDAANTALADLASTLVSSREVDDVRSASLAAEQALLAVIQSAAAGRRATAGPASYDDRIAFRKALARADVDVWTRRLRDLRTRRETLKLDDQASAGLLLPNAVQVENSAAEGPHIFGMEAPPGTLRAGVDIESVVDR